MRDRGEKTERRDGGEETEGNDRGEVTKGIEGEGDIRETEGNR